MKYQTVVLANSMDLHVWGPVSVRRNDITSLDMSKFEELLEVLVDDMPVQVKCHGNSAYVNSRIIESGGGRRMASVREIVEWSYKDVKQLWKYCDFDQGLKLRKQPVAKIIFVCLLEIL